MAQITILGNTPKENMPKILNFPVDNSIGPNGFLSTVGAVERDKQLYPLVSKLPKEQVEASIDSGIMGPLLSATETENYKKKQAVYEEIFTKSALDDRPAADAIAELESLRESNSFLSQFVSPATLAMLKQSDNPTARKMAVDRITNVFIAADILQKKTEENEAEGFLTNFDFVDVLLSDSVPGVSLINVKNRKDLANKFVQVLASNKSPDEVTKELQTIVDEASDMGFFTENNRFHLADFMSLVTEGTQGAAAGTQEFFGILDALPAVGLAMDAGKLTAFTRRSPKEVKQILEDAISKDNPVSGHSNPASYGSSITDPGRTTVLPAERAAVNDIMLESNAWKAATEVRIASGKAVTGPEWDAFSASVEADYKARAEARGVKGYIDADVVIDDFENVVLKETFGTKKGTAYKRKQDAERVAADMLGSVVEAPDKSGWLIVKDTNIPMGEFSTATSPVKIAEDLRAFKTTNPEELANNNWYTRWFGSPALQTSYTNHALLVRAEASRGLAGFTVMDDFNKSLKLAGRDGAIMVDKVITEIRDGALANVRPWISIPEFENKFLELNKRLPTEAEKSVYVSTVELADVNWRIAADFHLKREVNKGIQIFRFDDGLDVPGVVVTKSDTNSTRTAWDLDKKKYVKISDVDEAYSIVRLVEPLEFAKESTEFVVTKTPKSRALKHQDVLGYNAGGPRLYTPNQTNFIVKQSQEIKLVDGKVIEGRPTTILVGKTEKEARKAVTEINSILETIHSKFKPSGIAKDDYTQILKGQTLNDDLNKTVFSNTGWNKQITNLEEFIEHWESMGLDLRKTVDFVGDGEPLVKNNDFLGDLSFRDSLSAPGRLKRGDVRRDNVLVGYGGTKLDTVAPLEAVSRTTMASVARASNAAYETASINGLLKKLLIGEDGKPLISPKTIEEIRFLPTRQKVKALEGKIFNTTKSGKKLELERLKIVERLEQQNYLDKAYEHAKNTFGNILYDKGWTKTSKFIDSLSPDPIAGMRGIVFDAYLGMFAPDQFFVQSQQAFAVMSIADHFEGIKAVAAYPYIRKMIANGHIGPIKETSKLLAKTLGIKPEQVTEIVESFRQSGRWAAQAHLSDLGEDAAGKVMFDKVRRAGRFFYTEGELVSRINAHTAASLEFIQKFPGKSLMSEEAKNFVAHRADIMTASMSSVSRGPLEHLPFMQFMSYSMRMGEQLLAGTLGGKSVLSSGKKIKLMAYQLAFYGTSAIPFVGAYMDYYEYKYGTPFDPGVYNIAREGMFDALMSEMTGVETEFGRRVAWGEGIFNTIDSLIKGNIFTAFAGPTGSFTGTLFDSIVKLRQDMMYGGGSLLPKDIVDVFRTIKSVNMSYNAIIAWNKEEFHMRDGTILFDDMNRKEAIALAMGIPLEKINEHWRDIKHMQKDKGYYQDRAGVISRLWNTYASEVKANGNSEQARKIREAIAEVYRLENAYGRSQIDRYVDDNALTENEELLMQMLKTDAARVKEDIKNGL